MTNAEYMVNVDDTDAAGRLLDLATDEAGRIADDLHRAADPDGVIPMKVTPGMKAVLTQRNRQGRGVHLLVALALVGGIREAGHLQRIAELEQQVNGDTAE